MTLASRSRHRGFTLVELLVVLTIIGLLMAILVPTVFGVLRRARDARIAMEIASLSQSLEAYKLDAGDYPPNFNNWALVKRHILKRWQQLDSSQLTAFKNMCSGGFSGMGADAAPSMMDAKPIDPAEALVFWLGGPSSNGGLKANDVMPFSTSGEAKQYFEFDQARLSDKDGDDGKGDGWNSYEAPACMNTPYVYFDARAYAGYYATAGRFEVKYDSTSRGKAVPAPKVASPTTQDGYVNPTTYQILAAGQDGNFGSGGAVFPDGPYVGPNMAGDKDNIANYTEGKTLQDSVP